ncbi:hypothetical protein BU204_33280 [Actinophytocola xanthii]|uniref:Uncharacterized protein n=1 Tax=Actinophytocola xanthii TaxID=1912961 RepID=A0A1Q8C4G8_9PSEU|nr:hypothetical protein BU204_33280 [Actinophytocola xanthii]
MKARERRARAARADDAYFGGSPTIDLFALIADELEAAVRETLALRSPEPARLMAAKVHETDLAIAETGEQDEDEGAPGLSIAFAVLTAWIAGAHDELHAPGVSDTVLRWIAQHLGEPAAGLARRTAGILGVREVPAEVIDDLVDDLGPDFIPSLVWIASGLVAEHGAGDPAWLRRHDLPADAL